MNPAETPTNATSAAKPGAGSVGVRLAERCFAPVDIAPLVWFRIAFGLIMLAEVCRYFFHGWIEINFIEPKFFFTYYGFSWIHPWPGYGMFIHFAWLGLLAAAISLGLCYRVVTVLFFLSFTYVFLLDETLYLNHFYLVCLFSFLLIFVPAHRAFSLDAKWRPGLRSPTAPAWSLWVLRAQICVVYFMGGVAKLSSDWLHGEPMRIWLEKRTDFPLIGRYFEEDWMAYAFSYGGLCFDLLIAPMVIWRRTRWLGFILAALFNIMNARLFRIGIFPWLSLGATVLLFASPKWFPRPFKSLWGTRSHCEHGVPALAGGVGLDSGRVASLSDSPAKAGTPCCASLLGDGLHKSPDKGSDEGFDKGMGGRLSQGRLITLLALGAWLAFQILVPLRHLILYPGNPEWTEEGHRFAWRMKLRDKTGRLQLLARDPVTRKTWKVDPRGYVTEDQLDYSADNPDMILQLCHHVAEEWRREHHTPLEVRVRALASLNGRPMTSLVDPEVDLAAQPRSLRPAAWILPLELPLRKKK